MRWFGDRQYFEQRRDEPFRVARLPASGANMHRHGGFGAGDTRRPGAIGRHR
jgi:hypothetical protein